MRICNKCGVKTTEKKCDICGSGTSLIELDAKEGSSLLNETYEDNLQVSKLHPVVKFILITSIFAFGYYVLSMFNLMPTDFGVILEMLGNKAHSVGLYFEKSFSIYAIVLTLGFICFGYNYIRLIYADSYDVEYIKLELIRIVSYTIVALLAITLFMLI